MDPLSVISLPKPPFTVDFTLSWLITQGWYYSYSGDSKSTKIIGNHPPRSFSSPGSNWSFSSRRVQKSYPASIFQRGWLDDWALSKNGSKSQRLNSLTQDWGEIHSPAGKVIVGLSLLVFVLRRESQSRRDEYMIFFGMVTTRWPKWPSVMLAVGWMAIYIVSVPIRNDDFPFKMVIFHSSVKLPEGSPCGILAIWEVRSSYNSNWVPDLRASWYTTIQKLHHSSSWEQNGRK